MSRSARLCLMESLWEPALKDKEEELGISLPMVYNRFLLWGVVVLSIFENRWFF